LVSSSYVGGWGNELSELKAAVARFQAGEQRLLEPKELRAVIDALEAGFSEVARRCPESGLITPMATRPWSPG
jgi:hypothetical protein